MILQNLTFDCLFDPSLAVYLIVLFSKLFFSYITMGVLKLFFFCNVELWA